MKERSMNQLFKNVKMYSSRKQPLSMPPLMTLPNKNLNNDERKDQLQKYEEIENNNYEDLMIEEDTRKQTHKETLNRFFRSLPNESRERKSVRRSRDDVPELESLIPISHVQPPSNPISMENTRMEQSDDPKIRIVGNEDIDEKVSINVSGPAQMALKLYNSIVNEKKPLAIYEKPIKQITKNILTNPQKMQLYLCYLQQTVNTIQFKKHLNSYLHLKQDLQNHQNSQSRSRISQNLRESSRSSPQKKKTVVKKKEKEETKNLQLLSCLLVKIRQCSIKYDETIPEVCVSTDEQLQIHFKPSKEMGKNKLMENRQKIAKLQQSLAKKQQFMHIIKHEYDSIIHNYAHTLVNMQKGSNALADIKLENSIVEQEDISESRDILKMPDSINSSDSLSLGQRLAMKSFQLKRKQTFGAAQIRESTSSNEYGFK